MAELASKANGKRKAGRQPDGSLVSPGELGIGRPKGSRNSVPLRVQSWILKATELAGEAISDKKGDEAAIAYLVAQAKKNPRAFMTLLAKVMPTNVKADIEVRASLEELVLRSMEEQAPADRLQVKDAEVIEA